MSPDDPRHGTYAGAVAHWREQDKPCGPCALAAARRRKLNRLRREEGRPGLVPALGTVRRLQALQAIGYGYPRLARETGIPEKSLRNPTYRGSWVYRATAEAVAVAYERLCMTPLDGPYARRSRNMAANKGWLPPLAWDAIDDPDERPNHRARDLEPDDVAIERALSGDFDIRLTRAERLEVVRRWTRSDNELERRTGWNVARLRRDMARTTEEVA